MKKKPSSPPKKPTTKKVAKPAHARLGPSSLKSREICPSYVNDQGSSAAANLGTKLHGLLEKHHIDIKLHNDFAFLDSDEQQNAVEMIADFKAPMEAEASKIHREIELDLSALSVQGCDFGTADLVLEYRKQKMVRVLDYKFGRIAVDDPKDNIQFWMYSLGCFIRFPWAEKVEAFGLQPLLDEVGSHVFTRADFDAMLLRARVIADKVAKHAGKKFNPVLSNCLWCANKANCAAMNTFALRIAKYPTFEFPPLPPGTNGKETSVLDLMDGEYVLEHGSDLYDLAKLMEGWGESVRRAITTFALEGFEIRGKTVRTQGGKSSITDVLAAMEKTSELTGEPLEEIWPQLVEVPIGKLDAFVSARAERGKKSAAKDDLRKALAKAGILYVGGPTSFLVDEKQPTS